MQLAFRCPACQQPSQIRWELSAPEAVHCEGCGWQRDVPPAETRGDGKPLRCLACGCEDLWRQKDFPQGVGLALVGLGILLSTIAYAKMEPLWALGILMTFALIDLLLYTFMSDVLVCYRCAARHRGAMLDENDPRFSHEVMERYRQEARRLGGVSGQ